VIAELQRRLNALGFPCAVDGVSGPATLTAVARFQLAYGWRSIAVDGVWGPMTLGALSQVESSGGRLSQNFMVNELRSKGDGTTFVHRDLLAGLERLRAHVGRPLGIVSAWRDPAHNQRVGGARTSQHTFGAAPELTAIRARLSQGAHLHAGRAADFNQGYIRLDDCVALNLFTGVGHRNGWVTHVDVRPGNPARPTVWRYG
jgi:peptidoglycan hydrolase-like protein with peptidoglycan-binding domain